MKPVHAGHWKLIVSAASECDEVLLYVSMSDRENVTHVMMSHIWEKYLLKRLPLNVKLIFCKNPVRAIFESIGEIDKSQQHDVTCVIYTDDADALERYSDSVMQKYFKKLKLSGRVNVKSFNRDKFADYSSTAMRHALLLGDKVLFVAMLPECIDDEQESERLWNDISYKEHGSMGI